MIVRKLGAADLVWGMDDNPPLYLCGAGKYERHMPVDPHPGYAHDVERVKDLVAACVEAFPLADRAQLCILEHEFMGRTNGLAFEDGLWNCDDGSAWKDEIPCDCGDPECKKTKKIGGQAHTIVLGGKRIPPMPSMTRYLVAHEYGHCAFNRTRRLLKIPEGRDGEFEATYLKVRGCEPARKKNAGERWHRLASEIIANDFRILVMKAELEFWPHEVPRPELCDAIGEWWSTAIARAKEPSPLPEPPPAPTVEAAP